MEMDEVFPLPHIPTPAHYCAPTRLAPALVPSSQAPLFSDAWLTSVLSVDYYEVNYSAMILLRCLLLRLDNLWMDGRLAVSTSTGTSLSTEVDVTNYDDTAIQYPN